MKYINAIYIFMIFLVTACGSVEKSASIKQENNDFFGEESFLRFDKNRLGKDNVSAPCFSGNIIDDLQKLRTELDQRKQQPHYWNQIATCYYLNKQYSKAEYYYQISLDTATKNKQVYYPALNNIGLLHVTLGHYITARDYFRKALKNNHFLTPRYNLALVHLKHHKPEMAIKLLSRFSKNKSGDPDLNFNLALSHYLLGQYQMASHYLAMMKEQNNRSDAIYLRGIMLYDQGKYQEAIELIENNKVKIKEFEKSNSLLKKLAEKQIERLEELEELKKENKKEIKVKAKVSSR